MADESALAPRKQERDCTKEVEEGLPIAESLAESGKLQESIDKLLSLEKLARNVSFPPLLPLKVHTLSRCSVIQAADLASTTRVLLAIVDLLWRKRELDLLNQQIAGLARKHGQLRQAIQKMVDRAVELVDELEGEPKLKLIEALREVTEGKVRFFFSSYDFPRASSNDALRFTSKSHGRGSPERSRG
jgi:26S proteasome regulatory subunit N5